MRRVVPFSQYSVTSAPMSGWLMRTLSPVYFSEPMPLRTRSPSVICGACRPGNVNPP